MFQSMAQSDDMSFTHVTHEHVQRRLRYVDTPFIIGVRISQETNSEPTEFRDIPNLPHIISGFHLDLLVN